jgi:hypothetical protein
MENTHLCMTPSHDSLILIEFFSWIFMENSREIWKMPCHKWKNILMFFFVFRHALYMIGRNIFMSIMTVLVFKKNTLNLYWYTFSIFISAPHHFSATQTLVSRKK